jgi:hypothetical protein
MEWLQVVLNSALTAGILAAIAFLSRGIIQRWIDMSIEKYKKELQKELAEHQTKFTRLHEIRAEVIAKLNGLLIAVQRDLIKLENLTTIDALDTLQKQQREYLNKTFNDYQAFLDYFDEHNLYFSEALCEKINRLLQVYDRTRMGLLFNQLFDQPSNRENISNLNKIFDDIHQVTPKLREEIKQEFREILGIN